MKRRPSAIISCATIGLLGIVGFAADLGGSARAEDATTTTSSTTTSVVALVTTSTSSVTLPLFGAQLTLDISAGPDGSLTKVFVNPADAHPAANTAAQQKPNKVSFVSDDGQSKVTVTTKHGTQAVTARTSQLADIVGKGSWTGDVFGTGVASTVDYEIFANPDGSPDIINLTATGGDPAPATATIGEVKHGSDDDRQGARVAVTFVSGLRSRVLVIRVGIGTHDGESQAKLEIALLREKAVEVPLAGAAGPHTWDGLLCDGSKAQIKFEVAKDGTLSGIAVTPATGITQPVEHGVEVSFPKNERVRIKVKIDGTDISVSVEPKLHCDSATPQVNTETTESSDVPESSDDSASSDDSGSSDDNSADSNENSNDDSHEGTSPGSTGPGSHEGDKHNGPGNSSDNSDNQVGDNPSHDNKADDNKADDNKADDNQGGDDDQGEDSTTTTTTA